MVVVMVVCWVVMKVDERADMMVDLKLLTKQSMERKKRITRNRRKFQGKKKLRSQKVYQPNKYKKRRRIMITNL